MPSRPWETQYQNKRHQNAFRTTLTMIRAWKTLTAHFNLLLYTVHTRVTGYKCTHLTASVTNTSYNCPNWARHHVIYGPIIRLTYYVYMVLICQSLSITSSVTVGVSLTSPARTLHCARECSSTLTCKQKHQVEHQRYQLIHPKDTYRKDTCDAFHFRCETNRI